MEEFLGILGIAAILVIVGCVGGCISSDMWSRDVSKRFPIVIGTDVYRCIKQPAEAKE